VCKQTPILFIRADHITIEIMALFILVSHDFLDALQDHGRKILSSNLKLHFNILNCKEHITEQDEKFEDKMHENEILYQFQIPSG
jgi:hypothetical protein